VRYCVYLKHCVVFVGWCVEEEFAGGDARVVEEDGGVADGGADGGAGGGYLGGGGEVAFEELGGTW